jgi:chemotaxis protein methyltransferase CheR
VPPSAAQWTEFYASVHRQTGLDLAQYKANQLQRRILSMAHGKGLKDLSELWRHLATSPGAMSWFLDRLAINVSELFRNPDKWIELEQRVLPELRRAAASLRCWSAGCSYGAEAYSLAAVLHLRFPGRHTILGTDIDETALAQAERGEFGDQDVRAVPAAYRDYFVKSVSGGWQAEPCLRPYLTFRRQNMLSDPFERGWDLILCRNVVIYFTEEAKAALYRRFFEALRPGGVLFVGSTERPLNSKEIGYETFLPFFYRKPNVGDQTWRIAY